MLEHFGCFIGRCPPFSMNFQLIKFIQKSSKTATPTFPGKRQEIGGQGMIKLQGREGGRDRQGLRTGRLVDFELGGDINSFITMLRALCVLLAVCAAAARDYPQYNQCDPKWKDEKLGTSTNTICQVGALVSAAAIGLSGIGINQNPSTLNTWLKNNKGYVNKDDFVWASINSFGVVFEGKVPNTLIKMNLDVGYLVLMNVNKGQHWVLATGYSGSTIFVVDSLYLNVKSYDISAVVSGNNGIYKVPQSFRVPVMIDDLERRYLTSQ